MKSIPELGRVSRQGTRGSTSGPPKCLGAGMRGERIAEVAAGGLRRADACVRRAKAGAGRARSALMIAAVLLAGCGGARERTTARVAPAPIPVALADSLEGWLAKHGRSPADYVLGLFERHDVVLLGEFHRIRHDPLFVQSLVPRLQAAGVHVLAIEFARREDQSLVDSIVTAPEWQERRAREVFFRCFMPWGYREYVDVLKAAWRVNRERPEGAPPFRVLGVNNSLDYGLFRTVADWDDPEVRRRVNRGQTEADWAGPVLEAVSRGEKVLAYCGMHHAFTGYRQPVVVDGAFVRFADPRFGNVLREALGKRAVTVALHAPWNGPEGYSARFVHPADGRLDAFMLARDGGPFAVGFDVAGSPLGSLPIENAVYRYGYEPFTLEQFCDGWVYTKPIGEYEPVEWIDGWIDSDNLERARATAMNPRWRDYTVRRMTAGCLSYRDDFRRFLDGLE